MFYDIAPAFIVDVEEMSRTSIEVDTTDPKKAIKEAKKGKGKIVNQESNKTTRIRKKEQ